MFQGTGSDVGKSLVVAGICRLMTTRGLKVKPFKPQNMSNNAAVTKEGGEIGRAQALQAKACKVSPSIDMNPILLKPQSEIGAQLIVLGKVDGNYPAKLYQEKKIVAKNELLLEIKEQTFSELIDEINPSKIFGFSTGGKLSSYEKIASQISDNSCIVIGGFQKGHFSESVENKITDLYSVGNESFEGHTVTSRILYEYEKTIFM